MKRYLILLTVVLSVLTGCIGKATPEEAKHTPSPFLARQERILGKAMEGKKYVYVKREKYEGEGYYKGEEFGNVGMVIHEANDSYAMLTYEDSLLMPILVMATKNTRGEYEFSFNVETENEESIDIGFVGTQVKNGTGTYNVCFRFEGETILTNIKGQNLIQQDHFLTTGIVELKKKKDEKEVEICDLSRCLGEYKKVYQSIYENDMRLIEVGKEPGTDRVSYVDVNFKKDIFNGSFIEMKWYQIGEINFLSTKEDCDRVFGNPLCQTDTGWEYPYQDDYVVHISFDGKFMSGMGIYLKSKEDAMKEYTEGDFVLRGCRLVDGKKCYEKGGKVKWPKDMVAIAPDAFSLEGKLNKKKVELEVPKDVFLEPYAFKSVGYMEITFEKGRKKIDRYAFSDVGSNKKVTIKVPSSVKVIEDGAFEQWNTVLVSAYTKKLPLYLSEGVEKIGDTALYGVCCDIPSTVKVLGDFTLNSWEPRNGKRQLPENVEEIGNECWSIEEDKELYIPASLKKIGMNSFVNYNMKKHPRFIVDSKNKYFKTGKNGWLYSKDGKELYYAWGDVQTMKIPEGVEYICCDLNLADMEGLTEQNTAHIFPKSLKENRYKTFFVELMGYWEYPY